MCLTIANTGVLMANYHVDSSVAKVDTTDVLRGLDLKTVPDVLVLHKVAKKYMGKWHYLFLAIKIEESGNTGHYSWLSINHYNLCGMRFPRNRRTYAISSTNTNYAVFRNWFECMLDFKMYIDNIEEKFIKKNNRQPKDEIEMIDYMFNSFNHFTKWKHDMHILVKYVKKKYK
ncbi:MAG: hypothetical protein PSX81_11105 [bacterium]|nr:hypothetical protein [bacterium]